MFSTAHRMPPVAPVAEMLGVMPGYGKVCVVAEDGASVAFVMANASMALPTGPK